VKAPFLRHALAGLFLLAGGSLSGAQGEDFGAAVQRSLVRSRMVYPDAAVPESPLSRAILARIEWLNQHDRAFFRNPDWPMRIAAAEALALGIRPRGTPAARRGASPPGAPRYLAVVTHSFSVEGASFRKGQQVVLEELKDYNKRGVTLVNGRPILIWLDNLKLLRAIPAGEPAPATIKVESARYGFPGSTGYAVSNPVQALLAGGNSLFVSDELLSSAMAQKLNRSPDATATVDPATGRTLVRRKILTVTYTINGGEKKVKRGPEGETLVLD
jgi:hypothetical protein